MIEREWLFAVVGDDWSIEGLRFGEAIYVRYWWGGEIERCPSTPPKLRDVCP